MAAILTDDRLALDGSILREIGVADDAAILFEIRGNLARDLSAVKGFTAVLGNRPQRVGVILVEEALARTRHLAARQIDLRGLGILFEITAADPNARRQRLVEDESFVGKLDGRFDELGPLHLAAAVF